MYRGLQSSVGFCENRILRLYNQFPRDYFHINEMREQLQAIAQMGFNAVWINPIQATGYVEFNVPWLQGNQHGSLYAMHDPQSNAFCIEGTEENLRQYAQTARQHDITPLFDLVLNHVAADSPLCGHHPTWFQQGISHHFRDCRAFNYRSPTDTARGEIIAFWQAYIDRYIRDYGFMGVRVDAGKHIPADVQQEIYVYIRQACLETHHVNPVIFVELLLNRAEYEARLLEQLRDEYQSIGISHIYISHVTGNAYWDLSTTWFDKDAFEDSYLHNMGIQSQIGGVVGCVGSHDTRTLFGRIIEEKARQLNLFRHGMSFDQAYHHILTHHNQELELLMKKKIALTAFMSNGGWYLLGGDEFGNSGMHGPNIRDNRKCTKLVFASHDTANSFVHHGNHTYDLRDFIFNINLALGYLPQPQAGDWVEYVPMQHQPNLLVIVRHSGETCNVVTSQLLLVNVSNANIVLHAGSIEYIQKNRGHHQHECPLLAIAQPIVLGDIDISILLNNPVVLNQTSFHQPAPLGTPPAPGPQ